MMMIKGKKVVSALRLLTVAAAHAAAGGGIFAHATDSKGMVAVDDPDEWEGHGRNLGPSHGKCCNNSSGTEYALKGDPDCEWEALEPGECVGGFFGEDCEGMTCGGGFYQVSGLSTGACVTPGTDSPPYDERRWTPSEEQEDAESPQERGCPDVDNEPVDGYYDTPTTGPDPGVHDDPHLTTLKGERYDYHGQCDLIYTTCPSFDNNKGLRIHMRTKHVEPKNWSTITNLAVKIGKDTFELQNDGTYRINSEVNPALSDTTNLAGHGIKLRPFEYPWWQEGGHFNRDGNIFSIALDNGLSLDLTHFSKTLKTNEIRNSLAFKISGVHKHRGNGGTSLLDCVGLSSTWDHPEGDRFLVGRSGTTYPRTDNPSFGKEWQVDLTKGDPMLFAEDIGQQLPDQSCIDGVKDIERRQLEGTPEGDAVVRQAEDACRHLKGGNTHTFEACVYDVIVTGDVSFAEDPWYNDEF